MPANHLVLRFLSLVLDTLHDERVAVSRQLDAQVGRSLRITDDMTQRRVEQVARHGNQLVDYFFRRFCQFAAALGVIGFAVFQIVVWRRTRRNRNKPLPGDPETKEPDTLIIDADTQRANAA